MDPFVAGSVRGGWAFRRLRLPWIVARGPGCGRAPALHLSYSILGCRCYEDGGRCRRPVSESIPELAARPRRGTSPRATFSASAAFGASILIIIARSGWRRHNKVCKVGVLVGGRVRGSLVPRARADVVSPSPQPSPKRRGRFRSFCCRFSSGRLGISPASAILDCRAWPWLWTSPSATSLLFDSRLSLLRGWWSVSPAGVGIHPGSESGTCFHSNRSCRLAPAQQGMQGWGVGWWKSSRVIGASSSCRCGLTLTPTLSQKERAIWILLLPVQFGAIGHLAGFGNPGLSRVALAVDKPQRYISLIRFSAVVATRMVVGVAGRCRNPSRIGVRDMLS